MLRNPTQDSCIFVREARSAVVALLFLLPSAIPNTKAQSPAFAGNSQHTAIFSAPAQHLNAVRWTTPIDLHYTGFAHYGAPLITPSNTILVPIKTSTGFRVSAFEGSSGRLKYTLTNDYIMPPIATNGWIPVYQPAIATPVSGARHDVIDQIGIEALTNRVTWSVRVRILHIINRSTGSRIVKPRAGNRSGNSGLIDGDPAIGGNWRHDVIVGKSIF